MAPKPKLFYSDITKAELVLIPGPWTILFLEQEPDFWTSETRGYQCLTLFAFHTFGPGEVKNKKQKQKQKTKKQMAGGKG